MIYKLVLLVKLINERNLKKEDLAKMNGILNKLDLNTIINPNYDSIMAKLQEIKSAFLLKSYIFMICKYYNNINIIIIIFILL